MHESSPAGSVFAFDTSELQASEVTVFSAWDGDQLMGIGALKRLPDGVGEVKSMRTHPAHLRRGVAAALLENIISLAAAECMRTLSLETGRGPAFDAALTLYRNRGFVDGNAFADYRPNPFSQFLHLDLASGGGA